MSWNGQKNLYTSTVFALVIIYLSHIHFFHTVVSCFVCSSIAKRCSKCLCESLHSTVRPFCVLYIQWDVKFAMHKTKILRQYMYSTPTHIIFVHILIDYIFRQWAHSVIWMDGYTCSCMSKWSVNTRERGKFWCLIFDHFYLPCNWALCFIMK